jgi:hypothetical protein
MQACQEYTGQTFVVNKVEEFREDIMLQGLETSTRSFAYQVTGQGYAASAFAPT